MLALRPRNYALSQSACIHSERGYSCSLLSCNIKAGWFCCCCCLIQEWLGFIYFIYFYNNIPGVCWPGKKNFKSIIKAAAGSVRDTCSAAASVMKMSCSTLFWDKVSVSVCMSFVCVYVCAQKVRKDRRGRKSVRNTCQTQSECKRLPDVLCCSLPRTGQTVITVNTWAASRLYTPGPWGSSPGTGGLAQLPFPHKSCLEQADYHSSPRRDTGTENSVKLFYINHRDRVTVGVKIQILIRNVSQHFSTVSKSQLFQTSKLQWHLTFTPTPFDYFPYFLALFCTTWQDKSNLIKSLLESVSAGMQKHCTRMIHTQKICLNPKCFRIPFPLFCVCGK